MAGPQILMFQKDDWMTDGTERGSTQKGTNDRPVKLACRNVWKLFGTNAASFIRERDGATELQMEHTFDAVGDASTASKKGVDSASSGDVPHPGG